MSIKKEAFILANVAALVVVSAIRNNISPEVAIPALADVLENELQKFADDVAEAAISAPALLNETIN